MYRNRELQAKYWSASFGSSNWSVCVHTVWSLFQEGDTNLSKRRESVSSPPATWSNSFLLFPSSSSLPFHDLLIATAPQNCGQGWAPASRWISSTYNQIIGIFNAHNFHYCRQDMPWIQGLPCHIIADNEKIETYWTAQHSPTDSTRTMRKPPLTLSAVLSLGSVKNKCLRTLLCKTADSLLKNSLSELSSKGKTYSL